MHLSPADKDFPLKSCKRYLEQMATGLFYPASLHNCHTALPFINLP